MGNVINVKEMARELKEKILLFTAETEAKRKGEPTLATILVGDDEGSKYYLESQTKVAKSLNIGKVNITLPKDITEEELLNTISDLNNDRNIHGIMVLFPLPPHIDKKKISSSIAPNKDIDGVNAVNSGRLFLGEKTFIPNTAESCHYIIKKTVGDLSGKNAVIVGRSNIVGKPLSMLLLGDNATVTIAHSKSKDLREITKRADIVVLAVGRPKMFDDSYFSEGQTVIDVGTSELDGKITGDVDFDKVVDKVEYITSVPGGVGALTTALLMFNVCEASKFES